MKIGNGLLAAFLAKAAARYGRHNSQIGRKLAISINAALNDPIQKTPAALPSSSILWDVLASKTDPLLSDLTSLAGQLAWRVSAGGKHNVEIRSKVAVVELLGPDGMISSDQCRFGLLLQHPNLCYPAHRHEAEELYLVLSGRAAWTTDGNDPIMRRSGTFAHHAKWQPHAMETLDAPLLALWGWAGNINLSTYSMVEA